MLRAVYFVAAAILLGACAGGDTTEPPSPLVDFDAEAKFKVLWRKDTGAGVDEMALTLQPWVGTAAIYVADHKGVITAFDKQTGKRIWRVKTDLSISAGIGGNTGMLFVGTRDGELVALWQRDGSKVWQVSLNSQMLAVPAADQNIVIAKTVDGNLQAFALSNGERLWSYSYDVPSLSLHGTSAPVIFHDGVIVGSDSGRLAIISIRDGSLFRDIPVAVPAGASDLERMVDVDIPVVVDPRGVLYTAAYQGRVISVSLENLQTMWSRKKSVYLPMAQDAGNLYLVDDRSHVWAVSKASGGATVWVQEKLHARPVSGLANLQGVLLLGDFDGYLHALDSTDGRFIARKQFGDGINVAPIIDNDVAYIFSRDGKLSAVTVERSSRPKG